MPQPDGPMKETNSPRATFRLTWLSASTGPSRVSKRSDTSLTSIAGSSAGAGLTAAAAGPGIDAVSIAAFLQRATARGAVNSLYRFSARASAGKGWRPMNRPRPISACTRPSRNTTSPRESV